MIIDSSSCDRKRVRAELLKNEADKKSKQSSSSVFVNNQVNPQGIMSMNGSDGVKKLVIKAFKRTFIEIVSFFPSKNLYVLLISIFIAEIAPFILGASLLSMSRKTKITGKL